MTQNNGRCRKQFQIAGAVRANAAKEAEERKHEMEVQIENVVKTQKEAQATAEVADREEQIAHNKESRATSCRRGVCQKDCRSVRSSEGKSPRTDGHQQRTPKRSSSLSESIMNRSQGSDRLAKYLRTTRILRSAVVYPRTHSTT